MRCISVLASILFASSVSLADPDPPAPTPTTTDPNAAPAKSTPSAPGAETAPVLPAKSHPADPVGPTGPWYTGPNANNRFLHLTVTGVLELYILSGMFIHDQPSPSSCRWCSPPSFDRSARNALVWGDRGRADTYSTVAAYVVSPIVGLTLLIASDKNASATRLIDDVLPVFEAVAVAQVFTVLGKWVFARERPDAYFADAAHPVTVNTDTYQSFWSGHAVAGFALTTAVGTVCHMRRYWTEPYVWAAGITLSLGVEYLRMAADKHYLSDVLVGGIVGIAAGLLVPRLMERDIKIVPMPNGVSVVAQF